MRKIIQVLALVTLFFRAEDATAQVAETAQPADYPDPQCAKPDIKLIKQPEFHMSDRGWDSGAVGSYNSRVKAFNRQMDAYSSCIRSYVDNANREAQRIQDQANANMRRIKEVASASTAAIQAKIEKAVREGNDFVGEQNAAMASPASKH